MRSDLGKLFNKGKSPVKNRVRRPKGYKKALAKTASEDQPTRETISASHFGWFGKEGHRNFGILRRYLLSQVGRKWDDIYSDICRHMRFGAYHAQELRQWLDLEVELHVEMIDGVPHCHRGYSITGGSAWQDLWVHPETGILHCAGCKRRQPQPKPEPDEHKLGDNRRALRIDGLWYEVTLEEIPYITGDRDPGVYDYVLESMARRRRDSYRENVADFIYRWGAPVYASHKRQMSGKEIRALPKAA